MNWKVLQQLDELMNKGEIPDKISKIPYISRLISMEYISHRKNRLCKTDAFDQFYLEKHRDLFNSFNDLISSNDLGHTNFELNELKSLVKLSDDRKFIVDQEKSLKEISTTYFNDAKYLKRESQLTTAVLKVLGLSSIPFDEHDQQYLMVLHCQTMNPNAIILCENDNLLRKPRLREIELWHAGGRNTAKLKYINEPSIPFYYLCDWDNRGMEIYQDIKANIFPNIQLIIPQPPIRLLEIKSIWKTKINPELFTDNALDLLHQIIPNKWIEEESINHLLLSK